MKEVFNYLIQNVLSTFRDRLINVLLTTNRDLSLSGISLIPISSPISSMRMRCRMSY